MPALGCMFFFFTYTLFRDIQKLKNAQNSHKTTQLINTIRMFSEGQQNFHKNYLLNKRNYEFYGENMSLRGVFLYIFSFFF